MLLKILQFVVRASCRLNSEGSSAGAANKLNGFSTKFSIRSTAVYVSSTDTVYKIFTKVWSRFRCICYVTLPDGNDDESNEILRVHAVRRKPFYLFILFNGLYSFLCK